MSVIIKGMEMPKNCVECKLSDHISPTECPIYSIEKGDYWDKRYKYCPLVEIPPHGRLIDADALDYKLGASDRDIYVKCVLEEEAPTIIEAEGE